MDISTKYVSFIKNVLPEEHFTLLLLIYQTTRNEGYYAKCNKTVTPFVTIFNKAPP